MKNLLFAITLLLSSVTVFGQKISVQFVGLESPKTPSNVAVNSINLENVDLRKSNGQGGPTNVYVVNKNQDNLSAKIFESINTGKVLEKVIIQVILSNGTSVTHNLTNAIISDYRSRNINGKEASEQFYIQFAKDEIVSK